ncbi:dnaJ homolog subfamily C member 21 [Drosophila biarmipes]|uniref:dnaJ homolog subfamily C member 21 n=1 Tax=Drosophila biarmipes TaxID=125945 RepID=UPI0007E78DDC|nr:dnaJ homolog subfamily C member 21 [Drosophila biarmipes]XP_050744254.1 dnaJ homolog subfamily C member 21 [Drosophila biarmipes]
MRCYYEELELQRDASDGDIKTAYRKMALRWHPDKNPDRLAEAKERFQLILQAYEVLSDPQERSWYDNHREQILRGKNSEYTENSLDVFQYFTSSCYKGYGDDEQGFYRVYTQVFVQIAAEDIEFMDEDDRLGMAPDFGHANSSYEEVVGPFYAFWQAYSTRKTYEWLCPYDVREIKERFILRKVEKEMKKIVQAARKERNEEVRNLVNFVRKRDRRVQAYRRVLEERAEANRLKQEEKHKEQLRKRQEELAAVRKNKVFNEGYEEQLKQLEQQYGSESDEFTDEDDDDGDGEDSDNEGDPEAEKFEVEYVDDLYCVACNKTFKNAKARANHEESKKHKENVERLCQEMEEEEEAFNDASLEDTLNGVGEELDELQIADDQLSGGEPLSEEESALAKRSKKNKKSRKSAAKPAQEEVSDGPDDPIDLKATKSESEDEDWSKGKKAAKKSKSKKVAASKVKLPEQTASEPIPKEAKAAPKSGDEDLDPTKPQHTCVTCRLVFDSKNKLFAHLKKTNHGVYIPKAKPDVEGKPPGKAKGKRNK